MAIETTSKGKPLSPLQIQCLQASVAGLGYTNKQIQYVADDVATMNAAELRSTIAALKDDD